jgi:hypothetical protein
MLVIVEELQRGDEILCPQSGKFIFIRVIRPAHPLFKKNKDGSRVPKLGYHGEQLYSSVYGSTNAVIREFDVTHTWGGGTHVTHHKEVKFNCTPDNHNFEKNFTLRYSNIWLLNREL